MRSGKYISIGLVVVFLTASISLASVIIWRKGKWPGPWPKQLKPYRQKTTVIDISQNIQETVFEIAFEKRDEFEKAWPENRIDGGRRLPQPARTPHAVEEGTREARIREEVVVEEVEMAAG